MPLNVTFPVPAFKARASAPSIRPPKKIAPLFTLVLIVLAPAKMAGTAFVMVNEFAVILLPIETEEVPADDEMSSAPIRRELPMAPVNVTA